MRINIQTIPHNQQRYDTVGDWFPNEEGELQIRVSQSTPESEFLVVIHELVESLLCVRKGITPQSVDSWDMGHPQLEDPGDDPRAPYHKEHVIATIIERLICCDIGCSWYEHEENLTLIK